MAFSAQLILAEHIRIIINSTKDTVRLMCYEVGYGYNTINFTPSVSFGGFDSAMITADSARVYP